MRRPDTVFCFDRDHTLSVRPPNYGRAVPLAWVKYLAHGTDAERVDVWATGNQRLRGEAGIPGFVEAIECWERYTNQPVFDVYDRLHEGASKPVRRDGLRIIADIYRPLSDRSEQDSKAVNDTPTIVVIDDVDLTDLHDEGFEHFLPDIFATLVEASDGHLREFLEASVSIPLDELPSVITEDECVTTDKNGVGWAYTNNPYGNLVETDTAPIANHYDPTTSQNRNSQG